MLRKKNNRSYIMSHIGTKKAYTIDNVGYYCIICFYLAMAKYGNKNDTTKYLSVFFEGAKIEFYYISFLNTSKCAKSSYNTHLFYLISMC